MAILFHNDRGFTPAFAPNLTIRVYFITTNNLRLTTNNLRLTTYNLRLTTYDLQLTTYN